MCMRSCVVMKHRFSTTFPWVSGITSPESWKLTSTVVCKMASYVVWHGLQHMWYSSLAVPLMEIVVTSIIRVSLNILSTFFHVKMNATSFQCRGMIFAQRIMQGIQQLINDVPESTYKARIPIFLNQGHLCKLIMWIESGAVTWRKLLHILWYKTAAI